MKRPAVINVICVLYVLSSPTFAPAAPAPPPDTARIRQWVADLAREDFAAREAASKALVEAGDAAVPALEAAAKDPDPEVQGRAREALKTIENRKIQPGKVLEILHGSAAFVEGGNLSLRDALKPLEKLGLRVEYDKEVDPAQPCSLTKHGQTALELVDQLAETCRLGIRIVPGGVRVVTKDVLHAFHGDLKRRLQMPFSVAYQDVPIDDVMKEMAEKLEVSLVPFPGLLGDGKTKQRISMKVQDLPVESMLKLLLSVQGLKAGIECRYGILMLVPTQR